MPATPAHTELCEVAWGRGRLGLALGALLAPALLAWTVAVICGQAGEGETLRVLFPRDECVLESGKLGLLCVIADAASDQEPAPKLRLDGAAREWGPYQAPVLLCRLELDPGPHEIVVGSQKLRIYVRGQSGGDGEPDGWPVYRTHCGTTEGWKDCAACHQLAKEDGRTTVGDPKEPSACSPCHSAIDFGATHSHPKEPLDACHLCHALHGSDGPSLLKAPIKQLCADCHD